MSITVNQIDISQYLTYTLFLAKIKYLKDIISINMTKKISIDLDLEIYLQLKHKAIDDACSMSQLIREAIISKYDVRK